MEEKTDLLPVENRIFSGFYLRHPIPKKKKAATRFRATALVLKNKNRVFISLLLFS
jgi:hypothetical protein